MKKILALVISLAPALSFAAPTGHQICKGKVNGKTIQFVYGTYAVAGDATVKIDGKKYEFDGSADENYTGPGELYTASNSSGSIRWIVGDSAGSKFTPLSLD